MTGVAIIKELPRRPWSQTSARIRDDACFENQILCGEIIDCVQQINEFGSTADTYICRADWKLRFTLGFALKKLHKLSKFPDDNDVFKWLQRIGKSLLQLQDLDKSDLDQIERFSAIVGSLPPPQCVSQHYSRLMQTTDQALED